MKVLHIRTYRYLRRPIRTRAVAVSAASPTGGGITGMYIELRPGHEMISGEFKEAEVGHTLYEKDFKRQKRLSTVKLGFHYPS